MPPEAPRRSFAVLAGLVVVAVCLAHPFHHAVGFALSALRAPAPAVAPRSSVRLSAAWDAGKLEPEGKLDGAELAERLGEIAATVGQLDWDGFKRADDFFDFELPVELPPSNWESQWDSFKRTDDLFDGFAPRHAPVTMGAAQQKVPFLFDAPGQKMGADLHLSRRGNLRAEQLLALETWATGRGRPTRADDFFDDFEQGPGQSRSSTQN